MVIYLRHPEHGEKVACAEQEAVLDEAKGWERFTHEPAQPESGPVPETVLPEVRAAIEKKVVAQKRTYNRKA